MHTRSFIAVGALLLAACLNDEPTAPDSRSATEPTHPEPALATGIGSPPTELVGLGSAWDINASGQIVGDGGFWQAGVVTKLETSGGGTIWARGISDAGHIVGLAEFTPSGVFHAFLWQNGTMRDLGTLPGYDAESAAERVNEIGQAVGYSFSGGFGGFRATLWANGVPSDLGALAGDYTSLAYDINAKGHVVGLSHNYDEEEPFHGFLYINGTMRDLGTLGGTASEARGINAYDQVVGQSSTSAWGQHAFVWEGGKMRDLGTLPGMASSYANDINDNGQVVGYSRTSGSSRSAFVWYNGVVSSLPSLGGDQTEARAINASGQVVGYSNRTVGGPNVGVRWTLPPVNFWTGRSALPAARRDAAVGAAGGMVYVLGGVSSEGTALKSVVTYDPGTNTWSTGVPLPAARQAGSGAALIGSRLYVAGGYDAAGTLTRTLYAYNLTTKTWSTRASLPIPSGCGGSGVIGGKLYVFTGCSKASSGGTVRVGRLHRYDPSTNTWTTLPSAPDAHYHPAVGVLQGKLYVAGGIDAAGSASRRLDVYNPSSNTWSTKAAMPTARRGAAGAVVGGRFHVMGGRRGDTYLKTVEAYDPVTNFWVPRAAALTARAGLGVGVVNGLAYAVGGRTSTRPVAANQRYTP